MLILSMILFSLAVSVDGFGVGFAYGMKNIRIPFQSLAVICLTSSTAIALSMMFGKVMVLFIPLHTARIVGALILVIMGVYMLIQAWVQKNDGHTLPGEEETLLSFRVPPLGILIQILKEPSKADMDRSGTINLREALILGIALAMDALGAGFAVAVAGFPPFWTALLVAVAKFLLVSAAVCLGRRSSRARLVKQTSFVPGLVLLILGLSKFH